MFNIWEFVKFLSGVVVAVILLSILFEVIQTFINNRKKQAIQDKMLDKAQEMMTGEIRKHIKKEITKMFDEE